MTHPLFEHLHHRPRIAGFRFTYEQVKVLRHDHVAIDTKSVFLPVFSSTERKIRLMRSSLSNGMRR